MFSRAFNRWPVSLHCCSVTKACPTLWPRGLHHSRLPCLSLSPRVCPSSWPLNWWSYPTCCLFPFCLQSFPASGFFPMSWLFASGGQCIGGSASASVLLMRIQGWLPLGWTGLIFLQSKRLKSHLQHHSLKALIFFFGAQLSLWSNSHICTWLLKIP